MASDVLMPQMGESIAEGTIVRWIKKVGESVDRDEPLFEISTDKVDAEIPSPASGVLTEIRAREGETVPVNSVVAVISPAGTQPSPAAAPPSSADAQPDERTPLTSEHAAPPPAALPQGDGTPSATAPPSGVMLPPVTSRRNEGAPAAPTAPSPEDRIRQRSSPLVRRIAQEHQVDLSQLQGTGVAGRVTKQDILSYIDRTSRSTPAGRAPAAPSGQTPATGAGLTGQTVPLSVMRRKIAEHMVLSKRTSAHVHTVFEVNFSRVEQLRQARKAEYEASGTKLTYLAFIVKAAVDALRAIPVRQDGLSGGAASDPAQAAGAFDGPVKVLTSCPSCLQGLARYEEDAGVEADYVVVELARHILGEDWLQAWVRRANDGGIERVLV